MQKAKKRIAIIGHFGGNELFTDGQTVKTINLYNELIKATDWNIIKVDTYTKKKHPIKLLLKTIGSIVTTKDIIILLSSNGIRFYFPLLYIANRILGTRVYHDVIGGSMAEYVQKNPRYKKYLNSFKVNWVETKLLKEELGHTGIKNVDIIPNFRRNPITPESKLKTSYSEPYQFCTFSRVIKEKGIEDALKAIELINNEAGREVCTLDIYGPIDRNYAERFKNIMECATPSIRYCGEVDSRRSTEILSKYFATLFPTYWKSESNAGTISESFCAGTPVIATDWRCNGEMIKSGVNGVLYPSNEANSLVECIKWLIDSEAILDIKRNCLKASAYYYPDIHIKKIVSVINGF